MFDKIGSVLRDTLRERVIVTMKSGEAFDGVLIAADHRAWELVNAKAIGVGERGVDVPVDGSVILPSDNVAYCQRP